MKTTDAERFIHKVYRRNGVGMSKKVGHTKGSWKIEKEGTEDYWTGCLEINHPTDNEICIALCYPTNPNIGADANLIASAPLLLEACKDALREWTLHGALTDTARVLKRAIAKAEGEN